MQIIKSNPQFGDLTLDVKVEGVSMPCYAFVASTHPEFTNIKKKEGEAWGYLMQRSATLKSHYTEADRIARERFADLQPIKDGDLVEVDGVEIQLVVQERVEKEMQVVMEFGVTATHHLEVVAVQQT